MKILHVNYSDINGGAAIACNRLHQALIKGKIDSWLLVNELSGDIEKTIGPNSSLEIAFAKLKKFLSIKLKKIMKANNIYKDSISFFKSNVYKKINNLNPDIINLHWICNEMIALEQLKKLNKPVVWTIVDMWPFVGAEHYSDDEMYYQSNKNPSNSKKKNFDINYWVWKRKIKSYKNNFFVVCISKWLAKKAKSSLLFKNNNIITIPCTIDSNEWKPINKYTAREILNLEKNKKYIVFSAYNGIDDYRKGFDLLLESLKKLKFSNKDLELIIIGKANNKLLLNSNIKFKLFEDHFFGNSIPLRLIYSASDLIAIPSRVEAFGQVALEAGCCEIPSVGFNNTGLEDVIDHQKNGYLANHLSVEDFTQGLDELLNDEKNNIYKKNIRSKIINNFSYDKVASQYLAAYKKLI